VIALVPTGALQGGVCRQTGTCCPVSRLTAVNASGRCHDDKKNTDENGMRSDIAHGSVTEMSSAYIARQCCVYYFAAGKGKENFSKFH